MKDRIVRKLASRPSLKATSFAVTPLLCIAFASSAQAQLANWDTVRMGGGGYITGLVAHRSEAGLIYARTDVGGAYRWNGNGWTPVLDWISRSDSQLYNIESIAIDPNNKEHLYVSAGDGGTPNDVLRSTNRGGDWEKTGLNKTFFGNGAERMMGERLQVDPDKSGLVFCGTRTSGLWKRDFSVGGSTWSQPSTFFNDKNISFVAFDKGADTVANITQTIYVGVYGGSNGGVYRSQDGGANWAKLSGPVTYPRRGQVADDGTLYVTWGDRSSVGGVGKMSRGSWSLTNYSPSGWTATYNALAVNPTNSNQVIAVYGWESFRQSIYRSNNGGASWSEINVNNTTRNNDVPWWGSSNPNADYWSAATASIIFDPFNSSKVFYGDWYGIWITDNVWASSTTWYTREAGHEEMVSLVSTTPTSGAPLLTGIADNDGFRHSDLTAFPSTRIGVNGGPAFQDTSGIDFCEGNSSIIARVGGWRGPGGSRGSGGYSTNGGQNWTVFNNYPANYNEAYPASATTKSNNGAARRYGRIAVGATVQPNGFPILVWVPEGAAPVRSTDGGQTWSTSTGAPTESMGWLWNATMPLCSDRVDGNKFYLVKNGQVYRSTNGGANWSAVGTVPWKHYWDPISIKAAPGRNGEVWYSAESDGLWRSSNSGDSFAKIGNVQRADFFTWGKAGTSGNPALYVYGTVNNIADGVFRSDDLGANWTQIYNHTVQKKGLVKDIRGMDGDRQVYGRVYIHTAGRGTWMGSIGGTTPAPAPTPTAPATTNLLSNPGFEAEQYSTQTPSGWSETQYDASWNIVAADASYTEGAGVPRTGNYHGTHKKSTPYRIYLSQTKTGLTNGLYTLRVHTKSSGGQNNVQLEAANHGDSDSKQTLWIGASSNYELKQIQNINVTNGQCTVAIWNDANANNWLYFDDFELVKQ